MLECVCPVSKNVNVLQLHYNKECTSSYIVYGMQVYVANDSCMPNCSTYNIVLVGLILFVSLCYVWGWSNVRMYTMYVCRDM